MNIDQLEAVQQAWKEVIPSLFKGFLADQGLKFKDVQWLHAQQGSVVLDFAVTFESERVLTEESLQSYDDALSEFLSSVSPEKNKDKLGPVQLSFLVSASA